MHPEIVSTVNVDASGDVPVKPPAPAAADQTPNNVQPVVSAIPDKPDTQHYSRPQVPSSLVHPTFAARQGTDAFVRPVPVRPAVAHLQATKLHQPGCAMNPQR